MAKQKTVHPNQAKTYDDYIAGPVNMAYRFARYQDSHYHRAIESAHVRGVAIPKAPIDALEREVEHVLFQHWEHVRASNPKVPMMWGIPNPLDQGAPR